MSGRLVWIKRSRNLSLLHGDEVFEDPESTYFVVNSGNIESGTCIGTTSTNTCTICVYGCSMFTTLFNFICVRRSPTKSS